MRNLVISAIEKEKIIVIVRGIKKEKLISLAEAMYDGGVRLLEITSDAKGAVTDEETAETIKILSDHFGQRMFIGAGTVLTEKQVILTKNAGGQFIISPDTSPSVISKTLELGMVSIPGALTPTEIQTAYKFGADFVKLFPVTNMGTGYVKAVKAPLSHIKMLAVGGIDENNIKDYLSAGISGFGIGSNIVDKKLIDNDDFEKITQKARNYIKAVAK